MNEEMQEILFDLLTKKATYGLNAAEQKQFDELSADANFRMDDSFDIAAAAIGLMDLEIEAMPAHLHSKILASGDSYFASIDGVTEAPWPPPKKAEAVDMQPTFAFEPKRSGIANWLGWALAAAACVALAFNIYTTRIQTPPTVAGGPTPTVTPDKPNPAKQYEDLLLASNIIKANFGAAPKAEPELSHVAGEVIWSDEKQAGYMKLRNLPKNDKGKSTYQLWLFEENQGEKTPIDGGTFDVDAEGEVIIPINAKLKAKNPGMFAITVEKPGGVVVSKRDKIAALAQVGKA